MAGSLKLALKELRKKPFFSLMMLVVCIVAMHMVLSSSTNAASTAYQQMIFEQHMGYDLSTILHLDY